jgi:ATP-binding cassette subfamily F protein 3
VRLAYFSQQGRELDEAATALESVLPLTGHDEQVARGLLGRFLFTADEVHKTVAQLSGGERSRLRLLRLLTGDANFLVLDEPTNHLDVDSVEALAAALTDYIGTVLLITHDRHLIESVATRVLEIHDSRLVNHLSAGRYWEARAARREPPETATANQATAKQATAGARRASAAAAPETRAREAAEEVRRRRARQRALEADILRAEKQLGEIDARLADPHTYDDRAGAADLAGERERTERRLEKLYLAWDETAE